MSNRIVKNIKKNTNWNITNEEIKGLLDMFGEDAKLANSYGVKYWNIYYKISMDAIDNDIYEFKDKIIGDYIVFGESAIEPSKNLKEEETIYYRVLLTETHIFIYALDHKCNLLNKDIMNIEDIKKVRNKLSKEESCNELLLIFKGKYFSFYGIDNNSQRACGEILSELKYKLEENKVPIVDRLSHYVA